MAVYRKESDERYAGTDAEYRERTIEKGVEWAERFLGDLSETQRATVTKMLDLDRDRAQAASRARLEANARFVAAMRKEGGEAGVRAVKAALKDPFALYSPEGKALVQARRAHFRTVLFAAAALMTREQRAELRIRVLSWTADLRAVAKGR